MSGGAIVVLAQLAHDILTGHRITQQEVEKVLPLERSDHAKELRLCRAHVRAAGNGSPPGSSPRFFCAAAILARASALITRLPVFFVPGPTHLATSSADLPLLLNSSRPITSAHTRLSLGSSRLQNSCDSLCGHLVPAIEQGPADHGLRRHPATAIRRCPCHRDRRRIERQDQLTAKAFFSRHRQKIKPLWRFLALFSLVPYPWPSLKPG